MNATPHLSSPLSLSALLTPLLWGAALLFFLLAGRSMLRSREVHKRWDRRIEGGAPPPNFSHRWTMKMGRIRFRLLEFAKRTTQTNAPKPTPPAPSIASAEPSKKPFQPVLPLFETPNGKPKETYAWNETKEID